MNITFFINLSLLATIIDLIILNVLIINTSAAHKLDARKTKVWGPGLHPDRIIMPARYFFIQAVDNNGINLTESPGDVFKIIWKGYSTVGQPCRIWLNNLDRYDGSFIIRYKLYHTCYNTEIIIKYNDEHVGDSPYKFTKKIQPEECFCPSQYFDDWMEQYQCKSSHSQIERDLKLFPYIDFNLIRSKLIEKLHKPASISFCHYVIKQNEVFRKCYGQHVGFKKFIDDILLSLSKKVELPDNEFFVNLGDWPLIPKDDKNDVLLPMFSWCGSNETIDIVLPTYDITEASLENMGRVMLDMLSVQTHANKISWKKKIPKIFWRGRDSRPERLTLIDIARKNPDLFNVSLTNFFFYRHLETKYGPKTKHISFFDFFQYKYQLNIDGTVAAYRFPYLLAGNSLVFKQDSEYYEFFYKDLTPMIHYVPIKSDLSDLVEKINWALKHDDLALNISRAGEQYAREHLLPHNIFCYHALLLKEWSKRIRSSVEVLDGMEHVNQLTSDSIYCDCPSSNKDEL